MQILFQQSFSLVCDHADLVQFLKLSKTSTQIKSMHEEVLDIKKMKYKNISGCDKYF
jgi:hypothetical protein